MKNRVSLSVLFPLFLIFTGALSAILALRAADTQTVTMTYSTGTEGNVFSGEQPHVDVKIENLQPGTLTGTGTFTVTDQDGTQAAAWTENLSVSGSVTFPHDIPVSRYGLYTLAGTLAFSNGTNLNQTATFAYVPDQKELTEEQKLASPYGINFHAGHPRIFSAFKKAGLYWYRDYAFGLKAMGEAKGADGRYTSGQNVNYQDAVHDYEKNGLIVMPNLFGIRPPEEQNGKVTHLGPTDAWASEVTDIIKAFPSIKYWELDNEYDLTHGRVENPVQWKNFTLYHKRFGELVATLGNGKDTAISDGFGGLFPTSVEHDVKSGDLDQISVISSHYYTGTEAPEMNKFNYNTMKDSQAEVPGTFFDMLRAVKHAAQADGKKRQLWLTEFGWDTISGPKVTDEQAAAYLQRGFLLTFAAGVEKSFWFFDFDSPKPRIIFDSCGLFNDKQQPKLTLSAMAGLSSILTQPVYVGSINAGPNTGGYVFEEKGELVAGLWALTGTGPKVTFQAKELRDYLGNKLEGLSADLKIAPVYAIGLDKGSILYRQTAYQLDTPFLTEATAGDTVKPVMVINNNRAGEIKATLKVTLPSGWMTTGPEITITVPPGQQRKVPIPYTIPSDEELGPHEITFTCQEGAEAIKTFSATVMIVPHFELHVSSIGDPPGKTSVSATVSNRTLLPQSGNLLVKVPQSWQIAATTIPVNDIPPGKSRIVPVKMTWNTDWKDGESASITFQPSKGTALEQPIIANQYHLNQANGITLDGDLSHWPKEDMLPEWMLGSTSGTPRAKLWLAWAPEGLYSAVEVHDSTAKAPNPHDFWEGDSLELFISTQKEDAPGVLGSGDHQFWFVPIFQDNRVYVGRWKMQNEIDATKYDLPGIKSSARKTTDGYVMEFLLPASLLQNFAPAPGGSLKLNANLTIHQDKGGREVYWPRNKATNLSDHADAWGLLKLN